MKNKIRMHFKNYQNMYIFLSTVLFGGFFVGFLVFSKLETSSIESLTSSFNTIFNMSYIKEKEFFYSNFFSNIIQIFVIFLFGLSVVGGPVVGFVVFTKGLQIGFSSALLLNMYSYKGIFAIILTIIPQVLIEIVTILMLSSISLEISFNICYTCFLDKRTIDLKNVINHYLNYFLISLILILISTLVKIYVIPYLIYLFSFIS